MFQMFRMFRTLREVSALIPPDARPGCRIIGVRGGTVSVRAIGSPFDDQEIVRTITLPAVTGEQREVGDHRSRTSRGALFSAAPPKNEPAGSRCEAVGWLTLASVADRNIAHHRDAALFWHPINPTLRPVSDHRHEQRAERCGATQAQHFDESVEPVPPPVCQQPRGVENYTRLPVRTGGALSCGLFQRMMIDFGRN